VAADSRPVVTPATEADWPAIWSIFHTVVAAGDTYAYPPGCSEDEARALWLRPPAMAFVARLEGAIVGTYMLKANAPGLGDHVANAGFMVDPAAAGRGIGRAMGEHALAEAKARGFQAMQFNFVVSSNTRAVALWTSLGFAVVGRVPAAFRHATLGLTDVFVMHRLLG
jgi:GNAT superfamily N-acetyltransferase